MAGDGLFGSREAEFRQRAEERFESALERHSADRGDIEAAWNLGRTAFDFAEFAKSKAERERLATKGIAACRGAVAIDPQSAPAHYYLGLNLGQLAKVRLLKGLAIVAEMEKVFLTVRKLDPLFDYAGADRALGLLYHQAPGWPISVGNRDKADHHLNEAVRLQPDYPGNRIALAEFLWETRQINSFRGEWDRIQALIGRVREGFSGPDWELSWVEWEHRLAELAPHAGSVPAGSPRQ
jgi:tetratricopeptide (TPR) repeat protein